MKYLKILSIGILTLALAVGATILSQTYFNAYAANTLSGNNEVITVKTTDGQPVNASIIPTGYSGDGNVILFSSDATNLPNAGGSTSGLYTYNIRSDTTARVDISTGGVLPDNSGYVIGGGSNGRLSETGRYVTFGSRATNLIDGATNLPFRTYIRDTQEDTTAVFGFGNAAGLTDKLDRNLAVSNDGRFVLLSSRYIQGTYPNNYGVVLGDNNNGSGTYNWTRISSGSAYYSNAGDMSCDGAFAVTDNKLLDLRDGSATLIANNGVSPIISCNGRYVLYATTNRTQITPTPAGMDTYLHLARYDRITGERIYVDSNSSNVFSTGLYTYDPAYNNIQSNIFDASIADTGDVVFRYKYGGATYTYLKHLSDGSGTLEPIAKSSSGSYVNTLGGAITSDGRYIFLRMDPYDLGLTSTPGTAQIIRTKTNL